MGTTKRGSSASSTSRSNLAITLRKLTRNAPSWKGHQGRRQTARNLWPTQTLHSLTREASTALNRQRSAYLTTQEPLLAPTMSLRLTLRSLEMRLRLQASLQIPTTTMKTTKRLMKIFSANDYSYYCLYVTKY